VSETCSHEAHPKEISTNVGVEGIFRDSEGLPCAGVVLRHALHASLPGCNARQVDWLGGSARLRFLRNYGFHHLVLGDGF